MERPDRFLPYAKQRLDTSDIDSVTSVLESDYLTTGPLVEKFERRISKITKADNVVVCSSGTAALHLASMALGLGPGDKVIVPAITFVATANAPKAVGSEVVFADVDEKTGIMEARHLQEAITRAGPRCKAVFLVHLGGQGGNLRELNSIARDNKLLIIEDASHAFGSKYSFNNQRTTIGDNSFSDISVFSFHAIKTIAAGEGGALTTSIPEVAEKVRLLRSHGITRDTGKMINNNERSGAAQNDTNGYYEMHELGLNYRLSDIHCALGLSQAKKIMMFIKQRKELINLYGELLSPLEPLVSLVTRVSGWDPAWHLAQVLIDFDAVKLTRQQLMAKLRDAGIGTQIHYIPVHTQPYYQHKNSNLKLPESQKFYSRCLSLPLFTEMNKSDVIKVSIELQKALSSDAILG